VQQHTAGALPSATTHARASTSIGIRSGSSAPPPLPAAGFGFTAARAPAPAAASPQQTASALGFRPASLSSCSAAASPARSRARLDAGLTPPLLLFSMESLLEVSSAFLLLPLLAPNTEDRWSRCMLPINPPRLKAWNNGLINRFGNADLR
jgi:hypothetical protein